MGSGGRKILAPGAPGVSPAPELSTLNHQPSTVLPVLVLDFFAASVSTVKYAYLHLSTL